MGEPIVRRLTTEEASLPLRVQHPSGEIVESSVVVAGPSAGDRESGFALRYPATEETGLYRIFIGAGGGTDSAEGAAVNPPRAESDLRPIDETELAEAAVTTFTFARSTAELTGKVGSAAVREVGPEALYLVLGLLLVETWLAMRFGSNR